MPELPEVETTRRGIAQVAMGLRLDDMVVRERRLRWPIPEEIPSAIVGSCLTDCVRRGKYLLLQFEHTGTLIVHLGMSGSIRATPSNAIWQTHDHVQWVFEQGQCLRYHDPRRFGSILWHPQEAGSVMAHRLLQTLGIEPFDDHFDAEHLLAGFRGRQIAIKQALLAGHVVVGVGNIYASESLFRARIHPEQPAGLTTLAQAKRLVQAIRQTLTDALESGGSTLRDYVDANGEPGAYFTLHAAVYEKNGQPCRVCGRPIRRIVQGQRATYFCAKCQPLKRLKPSPD
jgi:formamidopyrimidine-DNA glycosylase